MSDALKKVQPGETLKIRAVTFNTMIDAARDFRDRQHDRARTAQAAFRQSGIFLIKNASGFDHLRFDVLGIQSPIYGPDDNLQSFKNQTALVCVKPCR